MNARITATLLGGLLALQSWAATAQGAAADTRLKEELERQQKIYQGRGEERLKGYVIDRSLAYYAHVLPVGFAAALANLGPNDRWLDVGAGQGRAMLDYRTIGFGSEDGPQLPSPASRAAIVAMSIEDRRTPAWYELAASSPADRLQYLFGKPMGEYSAKELGTFRVISDVIGGFSYTTNLTRYMEAVLAVLTPGGEFYTVLQDVESEAGTNKPHYAGDPYLTEIVRPDGSTVKVCEWLRRITCVEVVCQLRRDWVPPVEGYRVRKTCDDVRVPALERMRYVAGTPPERRFLLRETKAPADGAAAPAVPAR